MKDKETAYLLKNMTWPKVDEALENVEYALIPVGSHEQHGPHIAESCDSVRAEKFAERLAERLHPGALVVPTVNFGVSPHHMPFPGTITLSPGTLISLLRDIVSSLYQHGIDRAVFVNSHGGNDDTLGAALDEIREEFDVRLAAFKYTNLAGEAIARNVDSEYFGHACEREVSEVKYLAPEILRENRIEKGKIKEGAKVKKTALNIGIDFDQYTENGALGDARKASREAGEEIVEEALDRAEELIEEFMEVD